MKNGLTVEGARALEKALADLPRDVRDEFADAVQDSSRAMKSNMVARAPRDQGDLQGSVDEQISNGGLTAEIGSRGIFYAAHVEWGTKDTPAQPYVFPSFAEEVRPLRKRLRAIVADIPLRVRTRVKRDRRTR